jgi:hypothetical protein
MMFDLNQDNFYLLVAWGSIGGGGIPLHHKGRTLTSKPVDFAYPPTAIEIMDGKASVDHLIPGKKRDMPPANGFSFPSPVKDYSNEIDLARQKMVDDMKQSPLFKYLQESNTDFLWVNVQAQNALKTRIPHHVRTDLNSFATSFSNLYSYRSCLEPYWRLRRPAGVLRADERLLRQPEL